MKSITVIPYSFPHRLKNYMQENKIEYELIPFDSIPEGQPGGCRFCGRSWVGPDEVVGIESELSNKEIFDILYEIMPGAAKHREDDEAYTAERMN